MRTVLTVLLSLSLVGAPLAGQTAPPSEGTPMFADVPKDHWAYAAIEQLLRDGIMIGYFDRPANTFRGDRTLTRYEFAYALARAVTRIQENIRQERRSQEVEEYLRTRQVDPKALEAFSLLLQEFKAELKDLNIRLTRLEERSRHDRPSQALDRLPFYLSLAAVLISLVSFTVAVQK